MNNAPPRDLPIYEVTVPFKHEHALVEYFTDHGIVRRIAWTTGRRICYDAYMSEEDCVAMKLVLPEVMFHTPEDNPEHF